MKRDLASIGLGLAIGLIAVALVSLCGCARPNLLHPGILDPKHPDLHVSVTDDLYLHQPLQPEELELTAKIAARDTTNFWGVYLGMITEPSLGKGGKVDSVMMFSALSGECLKWIPLSDFTNIFILKNRPEYLPQSQ